MRFTLPDLPYNFDALEPHVSKETLEFHYGKHHQGYVDKLNALTEGTDYGDDDLEGLIIDAKGDPDQQSLYNAAAQVWNHTLYWNSMVAEGGGRPGGRLGALIAYSFGGFEAFAEEFKEKALGQFGSGYVWLIYSDGKIEIASTSDAIVPTADLDRLLLNFDVWEHAYYLDQQNDRGAYVDLFLEKLVNWENAAERLGELEKTFKIAA
jgi:Fe-Mn family superoxide dismutase